MENILIYVLAMSTAVLGVLLCKKRSADTGQADESAIKGGQPPINQITWNEFYSKLRTLNGTMVNGKTFWIYSRKKISLGTKIYAIIQFDITGASFIIQGLDYSGDSCVVNGSIK